MTDQPLFIVDSPANAADSEQAPGEVESAFKKQVDYLESQKVMTSAHLGLKLLVLRAARAVDRIKPTDAASGQAQLIKALNEVAATLPVPAIEEVSVIGALKELFGNDSDEPGPYDNPPES